MVINVGKLIIQVGMSWTFRLAIRMWEFTLEIILLSKLDRLSIDFFWSLTTPDDSLILDASNKTSFAISIPIFPEIPGMQTFIGIISLWLLKLHYINIEFG